MKATRDQLATLRAILQPVLTHPEWPAYQARLANDPKVKDCKMRARWDALYMVKSQEKHDFITSLYDAGFNDSHIDTMLKAIIANATVEAA